MNLLTSYDWLREYVALKESPEELAARLSLCGPAVERLHPQGEELKGIVVGCIREIKAHPQADKLRLALVDVGQSKLLQIVCGGSNLFEEQWVAVAQLGSKVRWHGEGELVELKPTDIRGVASEGMICAANEIGLFDAFPHGEREILDVGKELPEAQFKPGAQLSDVLGLSQDTVMDIEITNNRTDAMCLVGLAREAATILKRPFTWKAAPKIEATSKPGNLSVNVSDKKLCPRYMAVRLDGLKVARSPWWLKRRLLSAGVRPINSLVDITNFVMLELGQPMHVFDADKLVGGAIKVRRAKTGETMAALDGKTYTLNSDMLVIADAEKPVAIAGVMGGEETGVTLETTSVVFEAAAFDPVSVRRTSRALNLFSDSQQRFEKGLSTQAPPDALARAVELALELAGGSVSSKVADVKAGSYKPLKFSITPAEVTSLIGVAIPIKEMRSTLERLGFKLQSTVYRLQSTVPWWRDHDIEDGRDLIEEIARIYGYANIPAVFPSGMPQRNPDSNFAWEDRLRQLAKGVGLTETFTYSFTSRDWLHKCDFDPTNMLTVSNPLTTEFEIMRTSLLPSLLQVVCDNQEKFRTQKLFELANVYLPRSTNGKNELPDEQLEGAAAFLGDETAWKEAKGFVEQVLQELSVSPISWKRLTDDRFWHPGRSVQAFCGEQLVATVGELHPTLSQNLKIEGRLALVHLPLRSLFALAKSAKAYTPLPQFPEAKRDLAFTIHRDTEVAAIQRILTGSSPLLQNVEWFDTYRGKNLPPDRKSLAFHFNFSAPDRTLETSEVDGAMEVIVKKLEDEFGAEVRK